MQPSQGLKVESHQAIRVVVPMRKDHTIERIVESARAFFRPHQYGFYAEVVAGGEIAVGDTLPRASDT